MTRVPSGTMHWQPSAAIRKVRDDVARLFGFAPDMATGDSRRADVVRMRCAVVWVLRCQRRLTWSQLAVILGRSDHTSAVYYNRRAEELRGSDTKFRILTDAVIVGLPVPERVPEKLVEPVTPRAWREASHPDGGLCDQASRRHGSQLLLAALQREHPERCLA